MDDPCQPPNKGSTSIHMTALDGIVNVNSLFTLAVFVGLAWNPSDPNNNLVDNPECLTNASHAENLVAFHVYSFGSFLFSSLLALALKQGLRLSQRVRHPSAFDAIPTYVNKTLLRAVLLPFHFWGRCAAPHFCPRWALDLHWGRALRFYAIDFGLLPSSPVINPTTTLSKKGLR
ncbi:hypothetical protein H6P81_005958 [Aristolochia fimbriata]|uniref:Uncharacterized protein n=1 Tax=Aristolochia fimbriata TaxID=158543 RepID=A0AAV7EXC1_ARIFI|nr:hypothetical protein H6P81_005958 [Aristolochia fimbriata]